MTYLPGASSTPVSGVTPKCRPLLEIKLPLGSETTSTLSYEAGDGLIHTPTLGNADAGN